MKLKHLMIASALFASTLVPTSFTKAQEINSNEEIWVDYDYNAIKDIPSEITFELPPNPEEISTYQDTAYLAFGRGTTVLTQADDVGWFATHATSISNGVTVIFFAVQGSLHRLPKGSTRAQLLDQQSTTVKFKADGIALVSTSSKMPTQAGDKIIAESSHQVNLGHTSSSTNTMEEKTVK